MPLSWNEIKSRAAAFQKEWENEENEDAEAKSFWDDFFTIFDIKRRRLASFEYHVKKLDNKDGYIDLFWPGVLIVEHKSKGKDLSKAHGQVLDYFQGIPDKQLPQYILVSDFQKFRLYDLENGNQNDFSLKDLVKNIQLFGFIAGYQKRVFKEQDPVNIAAAELMGKLHDKLKAIGYDGHSLELYLVRLLFCLFADDSNIFEKGIFNDYIELRTNEDGSDLARSLSEIFQVLNTAEKDRFKNLDEALLAFPYVNGKLFEENLRVASFDSSMRKILLDCCKLDWDKISPAIFGSLFQSVMNEKARRNLGAHYTSEKNILKVIKPLFLDNLWNEFQKVRSNKSQLQKFHDKISSLRFLDPACGCGNFLIIAYRELRMIELEIIKQLLKLQGYRDEVLRGAKMDIGYLIKCHVDQFYGIEYEEFPSQIARTAMWLIDHQMNMLVTQTFGEYIPSIPLTKSATIIQGNALRVDWHSIIVSYPWEKSDPKFDFIFGNPPFSGGRLMSDEQREDIKLVSDNKDGFGVLDYVSGWYLLAAKYIQKWSSTKVAFVSTNSICQGEQVGILWLELLNKYKVEIFFAHKTFKWTNEAKGVAAVFCVIVGFGIQVNEAKTIYEYEDVKGEPHIIKANNINPYLVDGKNILISKNTKSISNEPLLIRGSIPYDDGNLLLDDNEKEDVLKKYPELKEYIRTYGGSFELINNEWRFCLWLKDAPPHLIRNNPFLQERIEKVKRFRTNSKGQSVKSKAGVPSLFGDIRQPTGEHYLLIPRHSSEKRTYIPIGFISQEVILADSAYGLPKATLYHFGIITSAMHMAWVKYICGRIKSDFRYSSTLVYNNFPWPLNPSKIQVEKVETAAKEILAARKKYPDSNLADLYDPNASPSILLKAHQHLDKAVDGCYRPQIFANETNRVEYLFDLYDKYTAGLFVSEKKPRKGEK
jgi:hypothetical protein